MRNWFRNNNRHNYCHRSRSRRQPGRKRSYIPEQFQQGLRARAETLRTALYHRMRVFLERYEFLLCPVNQLPPFPAEQEYPTLIAGEMMGNYLDWMKSCYYITITSHPAISVPAGFTGDPVPLPVGLQIVGRYREDFGVLQLAHAFEQRTNIWQQRPPIATA